MPNNDYVKREDIFPAVTEIAKEIVFGTQDDDKVVDILNSIPAADVEPVRHGRWIRVQWVKDEDWQEGGYWIMRCSECVMPYHNPTPYCPHCGAKMDKEEGHERH